MSRKALVPPLAAMVLLSIAGWMIHAHTHPLVSTDPAHPANPANVVPFTVGFVSVFAVPALVSFQRTFVIGYLANGMIVVAGAIMMALISITHPPSPFTLKTLLEQSMLGSILLLAPKLFLGQVVLYHYHPNGMGRLFTWWFWTRHVFYLSAVFAIGHAVWR